MDLGPPLRFPFGCSYRISASWDGLLVLGNNHICNPVTRQWTTLCRDGGLSKTSSASSGTNLQASIACCTGEDHTFVWQCTV